MLLIDPDFHFSTSVTEAERLQLQAMLGRLNPGATIVHAPHGEVALSAILGTHSFDEQAAAQSPGWARELAGQHTPESEAFGITSMVYRARVPFHPERLAAFFASDWPGVLRSKGFFWIATRMNEVGVWAQAGDLRADAALAEAHRCVQAVADAITDTALRQGYLNNLVENREIVALWAARQGSVGR